MRRKTNNSTRSISPLAQQSYNVQHWCQEGVDLRSGHTARPEGGRLRGHQPEDRRSLAGGGHVIAISHGVLELHIHLQQDAEDAVGFLRGSRVPALLRGVVRSDDMNVFMRVAHVDRWHRKNEPLPYPVLVQHWERRTPEDAQRLFRRGTEKGGGVQNTSKAEVGLVRPVVQHAFGVNIDWCSWRHSFEQTR